MKHNAKTRRATKTINQALSTLDDHERAFVVAIVSGTSGERATANDGEKDLERKLIERALTIAEWKMDRAAAALGCSRRTLQNRMRRLGMPRAPIGRPSKLA